MFAKKVETMKNMSEGDARNDSNPGRFEVFFDGKCPLCRREIDWVRRSDRDKQLILTDISGPEFQPAQFSIQELMREIHGRMPDGQYIKGVDVFREIYGRLGYSRAVSLTRLPGIRWILGRAYSLFAMIRFRHAMSRISNSANDCESETQCRQLNADTFETGS